MQISSLKEILSILKETFHGFLDSKTPRLGASLAYYTIFAIAPLFLIALSVAGFFFGEQAARQELFGQLNNLMGHDGSQTIQSLVAAANRPKSGTWATIGAAVTLGLGATAVFVELQDAMNTIWNVKRKAGSGIKQFIKDRLLSFAMVLGIGFLLLVSLILSAGLAAVGNFFGNQNSEFHFFWTALNSVGSLAIITLLFAMIYKLLPDVKIEWRDVWVGAFFTALLFNFGKFLIGYYLGRGSMTSIYGAAGSFVILLLWVYYSSQILFFGAEFTCVYAAHRKHVPLESAEKIRPTHGHRLAKT